MGGTSSKEHEMVVIERISKPWETEGNWVQFEYLCPKCNVNLEKVVQSHCKCKYCPECGQKVRWK